MNRTFRKLTVWTGIVAVLFAQLALSAHACSMQQVAAAMRGQAHAGAQGHEHGPASILALDLAEEPDCCAQQSGDVSGICHEHCKDSKAISGDSTPLVADFVAAFVVVLRLAPVVQPATTAWFAQSGEHPPPLPLSILNCCFRI